MIEQETVLGHFRTEVAERFRQMSGPIRAKRALVDTTSVGCVGLHSFSSHLAIFVPLDKNKLMSSFRKNF